MTYQDKYENWLASEAVDSKTKEELLRLSGNEEEIKERFYNDLEFGTAGLRGILGAGTSRMNVYTVRKASQGLANYIVASGNDAMKRGVAIAYDSRHFSPEFAMESACVLAASGIKTFVFDRLHPVAVLSFAVRHLNCFAGIMITASHNPASYNGYKVYGEDGAQLNVADAKKVTEYIQNMDMFLDVKTVSEAEAKASGLVEMIGDDVRHAYLEEVLSCRKNPDVADDTAKDIKIVYTPFHGTGLIPVSEALEAAGYQNIYVVEQQAQPDPDFSTVKSPNPEDKEGFKLAIELAEKVGADVVLGTDPDADRIGVLVKNADGGYQVLTGNQMGVLLTDYILSSEHANGTLSPDDFIVKTIVTTDLTKKVADYYGVKLFDVYTGFKFIAEVIKKYDDAGIGKYRFGFEESYGCLPGTYARDKDAIVATLLVCELVAVLKREGKTLADAMKAIYEKYGYCVERTVSVTMQGLDGMEKMATLMNKVAENPFRKIADTDIVAYRNYNEDYRLDYATGKKEPIGYESSNVLYFELAGGGFFVIRPSGTEPKIKFYYSVPCTSMEDGNAKIDVLDAEVKKILL